MEASPNEAQPLRVAARDVIQCTEQELQLFEQVMSAVRENGLKTTVRVAGGWVRDKLLGKSNTDIDIALDDMNGERFAHLVSDSLKRKGLAVGGIGVVHANPEQSKHLETATLQIMGLWVDCVNLRSETYQEDSRIPEMKFGTPYEDACRRDFTINSMFFNLNTGEIEDYTLTGLSDLREGIVRTPLNPFITFRDDPLRILRAVRFTARFNFRMEETMVAAIRDPDIQLALAQKVSRERVGKELEGILSGNHARPALAVALMHRLGLYESVFLLPPAELAEGVTGQPVPPNWVEIGVETATWSNILLCVHNIQMTAETPEEKEAAERLQVLTREIQMESRSDKRLVYLASCVAGLRNLTFKQKNKMVPVVQYTIREGVKFRTKDTDDVCLILGNVDNLREAARHVDTINRVQLGQLIRTLQHSWVDALVVACASEIVEVTEHQPLVRQEGDIFIDLDIDGDVRFVIERYLALRRKVSEFGLNTIWEMQPALNGSQLQNEVGVPKGPLVGRVMAEQINWQLANPHGSREELVQYLREALAAMQN